MYEKIGNITRRELARLAAIKAAQDEKRTRAADEEQAEDENRFNQRR